MQNFITKPITQVQIDFELNRALRKLSTYEQKYIMVKNENGYFKFFLSDIEYIDVNRKVLFHLGCKLPLTVLLSGSPLRSSI